MEVLGKAERQGGMDTVQSHHVPEDIAKALFYIVEQKYETGQAVPVTGGQTMLN